ncbi:MAG: hypothetical protein KKF52_02470 [Nanoarchaeota archaeon]|nr:hypothetical protein [Nanoarchaeota archaeon]MBU4242074.1 hypothetical protein [Nanoarchaeota archaeon]MBU4352594.1 hypothetical protein [Nanoarchaeota archaeon]MCG2720330.1 hypothetical protein [Nanoarchaeota archaeon]
MIKAIKLIKQDRKFSKDIQGLLAIIEESGSRSEEVREYILEKSKNYSPHAKKGFISDSEFIDLSSGLIILYEKYSQDKVLSHLLFGLKEESNY